MSDAVLEERRRSTWRCGGKMKARAMEAGIEEKCVASFEKANPSIMRRNAMLRLGEELTYRT